MSITVRIGLGLVVLSCIVLAFRYQLREKSGQLTAATFVLSIVSVWLTMIPGAFLALEYFGWHWTARLAVAIVGGYLLNVAIYWCIGVVYSVFRR